jgi:predicted PurR-regulated permease PerM
MTDGICTNEKEEEKITSKKNSTFFNFWVYFGIIILVILFIIIIIYLIYSLISKNSSDSSSSRPIYTTSRIQTESKIFEKLPEFPSQQSSSTQSIKDTISTDKKSFLSSLMSKTNETTSEIVNPLYNRDLSTVKKTGGYRCIKLRRF